MEKVGDIMPRVISEIQGENMKPKITIAELEQVIRDKRGSSAVTLVSVTDPRLKKTGLPEGMREVRKESRVNGFINHTYPRDVQLQRMREGIEDDFVPAPRTWGERIPGTSLVVHKGKIYLEFNPRRVIYTKYVLNGEEIAKEDIQEFLPKKYESARQGTEKEIIWRDYALSSIKYLRIDGVEFEVTHEES